jgi:hypothetical protein
MTVPASAGESEPDLMDLAMDESAAAAAEAAPAMPRASSGPNVCVSCGAPLEPGAIICVQCGYNWKTGQHVGGATAGGGNAVTGAPASTGSQSKANSLYPPGYKPRRAIQEEDTGGVNKTYVALGAVALLIAIGVGGWLIYSGTGGAEKNVPRKGEDAKVLAMIDEQSHTEVKKWINDAPQRMLSGMTRSQALGLADRLYGMGAKKVFAFGSAVMCMSIGVELPDDPESRDKLFAWQARWHEEMFEKIQTDQGQQYLLIKMRI